MKCFYNFDDSLVVQNQLFHFLKIYLLQETLQRGTISGEIDIRN